jgi:hypothetical protein
LNFTEYFAQKRKAGFVALRQKQWDIAMAENNTMLIWPSKQVLDQRAARKK